METTAPTTRAAARRHVRRERTLVPVRFALLRLRRRWPQTLVVALGIAVGAAVLALTAVGSASVQDRAVQRALGQLQPSDRAVQTVWSGVPAQSNLSFTRLDWLARAATTPISDEPPFRVEVFRQATWGGAFVNLGAVDGLSKWVTLRSGRLPPLCTPQRLRARADRRRAGAAEAAVPPRRRARDVHPRRAAAEYFGRGGEAAADPARERRHALRPHAAPGRRADRAYVRLDRPRRAARDPRLAALDAERRLDAAQSVLERKSDVFSVAGPTDTIAAIRATSRVAAERVLILGGDAAVLLLGFAVLASTRLRREHRTCANGSRGRARDARRSCSSPRPRSSLITAVASIVGWLAGTGAGALFAHHLGSPGGLVVEHSSSRRAPSGSASRSPR